MNGAYDDYTGVSERTIDSHVRRVRRTFAQAGGTDAIETVQGSADASVEGAGRRTSNPTRTEKPLDWRRGEAYVPRVLFHPLPFGLMRFPRLAFLLASCALATGCELELTDPNSGSFPFDSGNDTGTETDTSTDVAEDTEPDTPVGPIDCSTWAGAGICLSSDACGGIADSDAVCGSDVCCYTGPLPSCEFDGIDGQCRPADECGAGMRSERADCGGPANYECCIPDDEVPTCEVDGIDGICIDVDECEFVSTPGHCPGAANIQCCTEVDTCDVDGVAGVCIDEDACDDGRVTTPGECPGDANIMCCHDPVSVGPCGSETLFACDNGTCIDKNDVCDRKNDCGDYSDEFGCETEDGTECEDDQLACPDRCVSTSKACNGTEECADGYDERDCD